MYSTCLFCHAPLGANDQLPTFPVGSRVAFDPELGRLWAICPRCGRWNLSALEERWEALEEAERRFRDTRLRYSTENIGLARLAGGMELVRVGSPLRQEMAAWRYGRLFGARRTRHLLTAGAVAVVVVGITVAPPAAFLAGGGYTLLNAGHALYRSFRRDRVAVRLPAPQGGTAEVTLRHIQQARLVPDGREWRLELPHKHLAPERTLGRRLRRARDWVMAEEPPPPPGMVVTGDDAVQVAGRILPRLNEAGGGKRQVEEAVAFLERAGGVHEAFASASRARRRVWTLQHPHTLTSLPDPVRLALEMAGHEEMERAALEGELRALEAAWRDAEEIAGIADRLALPPGVEERVERERGARS